MPPRQFARIKKALHECARRGRNTHAAEDRSVGEPNLKVRRRPKANLLTVRERLRIQWHGPGTYRAGSSVHKAMSVELPDEKFHPHRSEERRVEKSVDLGERCVIQKKKQPRK